MGMLIRVPCDRGAFAAVAGYFCGGGVLGTHEHPAAFIVSFRTALKNLSGRSSRPVTYRREPTRFRTRAATRRVAPVHDAADRDTPESGPL